MDRQMIGANRLALASLSIGIAIIVFVGAQSIIPVVGGALSDRDHAEAIQSTIGILDLCIGALLFLLLTPIGLVLGTVGMRRSRGKRESQKIFWKAYFGTLICSTTAIIVGWLTTLFVLGVLLLQMIYRSKYGA